MIGYAVFFGFAAISIAILMNLWRLAMGPSLLDRVIAGDTMVVNMIALIILYGIQRNTTLYFESALLLAMFSFISTIAYCRFVLRGDIIEQFELTVTEVVKTFGELLDTNECLDEIRYGEILV